MRLKRSETVGRKLRKTPQEVASQRRSRRSTKPRFIVPHARSARPTGWILPVAGSRRAKPPGLVTAQMEPSEVSPSHRTLSPPRPSCLVQAFGGACPLDLDADRRAKPAEVPTQRAPFRSRRMLQIK